MTNGAFERQEPLGSDTGGETDSEAGGEMTIIARSEWTARRIVMGTLTILSVAVVFLLVYRLYMVIFLLFAAIAVQVALSPLVEWLYQRRVPRRVSVMAVYAVLLALLGAGIWFSAPPLTQQVTTVARDGEEYYAIGRGFLIDSPISLVRRGGRLLPEEFSLPMLIELADPEAEDGDEESTSNLAVVWLGLRTLFAILSIFILAYYWTLEGDTILRKFVMKAHAGQREELRALIQEFQGKIGAYFRGTAILCVIVGVASTVAFLIIGIPNAILLGLVMAITEAIPIVGPILGAIPAIFLTLAVAPEKLIWVVGVLVLIQVLEGNILVPRVMDESVGVNPIVSILAIAAFGALFGIGGAILAIPMAAIVQILLARLLFNTPIREDIVSPPPLPGNMSRTRLGVLRMEAQEVIQDLHKNTVSDKDDTPARAIHDQAADQLETVAVELDTWLGHVEEQIQAAIHAKSKTDAADRDALPAQKSKSQQSNSQQAERGE